jgi:peptidoglycan/LPS O-acetylase OafA/YrhL
VLVVGPLGADHIASYFRQRDVLAFVYRPLLFRNIISIQNVFSHQDNKGNLDGSLWTIRFELFCYLLIGVAGFLRILRLRFLVLWSFVGSLLVYRFWHGTLVVPYFDALHDLPRFVTFFLAGSGFYLFRDRIYYSRWLLGISVLGVAVGCWHGFSLFFPIFGTYMLFYIAFSRSIRCYGAAKYGDFSYGTYLYAFPIQQLLIMKFGASLSPTTLFLYAVPLTLVAAVLSWHLVEKPFMRKSKKTIKTTGKVEVPSAVALEATPS